MTFPAKPNFPATVWDGVSDSRSQALDNQSPLVTHREPSAEDFSEVQQEILAIETHVGGGGGIAATTSTTGFIMLPRVAGVPTGVPANVPAGYVAACYDTTNHKVSVYDGGAWKQSAALA